MPRKSRYGSKTLSRHGLAAARVPRRNGLAEMDRDERERERETGTTSPIHPSHCRSLLSVVGRTSTDPSFLVANPCTTSRPGGNHSITPILPPIDRDLPFLVLPNNPVRNPDPPSFRLATRTRSIVVEVPVRDSARSYRARRQDTIRCCQRERESQRASLGERALAEKGGL